MRYWPAAISISLALRAAAFCAEPACRVPIRWEGPYDAAALDLLRGTPVDCLVVSWPASDSDLPSRFAALARDRRMAVVGIARDGNMESARHPGLAAVVNESDPVKPERTWPPRLIEGTPPGERALAGGDSATATPTTEPWIDSNAWLVRKQRALGRSPVWLRFQLAKARPEDYARAIADAAAAGGTWLAVPDKAAWRAISNYLSFFSNHADWREYTPAGPLAIIIDRSVRDEMRDEYLNLVARRRIPYRVIERGTLTESALAGLKAVLALGLETPRPEERRLLTAFVASGGLLVAGPSWKNDSAISGKGRTVAYDEELPDPEAVAKEMLALIGRPNLGVRLFNAASVLPYVSSGESGRRLLVQLVNYATVPAGDVTVRISGEYRSVRMFSPDLPDTEPAVERAEGQVQVRIRSVPVYVALLLEK